MRTQLVLGIVTSLLTACAVDPGVEDDMGTGDGKADGSGPKLGPVSAEQRLAYLASAEIWQPTDVATMDLLRGPLGAVGYGASPAVTMPCRFVEPDEDSPGGHSPKFLCERVVDHKIVKVKYSRDDLAGNASLPINGEVYGEALGTRLFWALGFFADRSYATKTYCQNCPSGDPWAVYGGTDSSRLGVRELRNTLVEDKLPGKKIEECEERAEDDANKCEQTREDQGWSFEELTTHSEAPLEHRDALRLLAAFVQHADNKAANQRLVCAKIAADGTCARSIAMVQDLGTTFGSTLPFFRDAKADLEAWRQKPLWKDAARCQAQLETHFYSSSMEHPIVTEEGRTFLADLMMQLSDAQIADLFVGARVDFKDPTAGDPAVRAALIAGWVEAFKNKRQQLVDNVCPR